MKVLLIHNHYRERGGEDAVAEAEAARLERDGHEVERIFVHNDDITGLGGTLATALFAPFNPVAQSRLASRLRAFKPDIAHVHNIFPRLSPAIFGTLRRHAIPSVLTLHNFRLLCPTATLFHDGRICERSLGRSTYWAIPQRVYRNSYFGTAALVAMIELHKALGTWTRDVDAFIALTPFARDTFIRAGFPAERIHVRGNAAEDPGPAPAGPRNGALYVGRLSPEKGIATLLEAWTQLDVPLAIAGIGPLKGACEVAASAHVTVLGHLAPDAVRERMQAARFLVLPSVCHEMFPMTLAEAFANGLPVIASRLGALASLVEDGQTGLLFEPGNPTDLAAKVTWASANPDHMAAMGANARARYLRDFTPGANDARLMEIYAAARQSSATRAQK